MNLYINSAEQRLKTVLPSLGKIKDGYGVYLGLSKLGIKRTNQDHVNIAVSLLRDKLKTSIGDIYALSNSDIIIVYHGKNQKLIEDCIYQINYLFADEKSQMEFANGFDEEFSQMFDRGSWEDFISLCDQKISKAANHNSANDDEPLYQQISNIVEDSLSSLSWDSIIKIDPVYKLTNQGKKSKILDHVYVEVEGLRLQLSHKIDTLSNNYLDKFIKEFLDFKVLIKLLSLLKKNKASDGYFVNINLLTMLTDEFKLFIKSIPENNKKQIIFAIDIGDVFGNYETFCNMKDLYSDDSLKFCLDNISLPTFLMIDRNALGFDLVRIKATNMDLEVVEENFIDLRNKIHNTGSSRVILKAPSSILETVGNALGITLLS